MGENERENRALQAVFVSQLLRERDPLNLDDLPELTDAQRAAMDALPSNLVEQIWDDPEDADDENCAGEETCSVDEEEFAAMNRAEEMTDETREALDQARREVIESMKKKRKEQDGADG